MTVQVRKPGPHKQVHESIDNGYHARATIDEHGYSVTVSIVLNYNVIPESRIADAHKQIRETLESVIGAADGLRDYHPPMFDIETVETQ
jgi:hypothetical protein